MDLIIEKIQVIGRMVFRGFVVTMIILLFDDKAVYAFPLGLLIGLLSEAKGFAKTPIDISKEQIKFAEWISENNWIQSSDDLWYYKSDGGGEGITTIDLFNLYSEYHK